MATAPKVLVISGTDRVGSNSRKISDYVAGLLKKNSADVDVLDLAELKPTSHGGPHYGNAARPETLASAIAKVSQADGIYLVVPEYNGSMPGALKYFIDHWKYPESFEFRPMALCGLGGIFGGLRPVEHLQGVLGYRNAFIYPERIFVRDVHKVLKDTAIPNDPLLVTLYEQQAKGFVAFINALKAAGIDANSRAPKP